MNVLPLIVFATALLAGCASSDHSSAWPAASPALNQETQCERVGAIWRPVPGECQPLPGATAPSERVPR